MKISLEEMERRREALRQADASNRIEGLIPTPESTAIFEAFVHGEIEFDDILPRIKALPHQLPASKRTPAEAAGRILAKRPFHALPEGMTIRDLMTDGRA